MIDEELLRTIRAQFTLEWKGIHGVPHWTRVRENGLRLAEVTGANALIAEEFHCFGREAIVVPERFASRLATTQGHKNTHDAPLDVASPPLHTNRSCIPRVSDGRADFQPLFLNDQPRDRGVFDSGRPVVGISQGVGLMITYRFTRRLLQAAAGCSMLAATTVLAQDRALLRWTGRVDKEVQITIRDTTISTSIVGGRPVTLTYFDVKDRLPMRDGFVRVELEQGRGDVDVIQQPSAKNDYAAIIRIRDHSVGVDNYRLRAFWNPNRGEDRYSTAAASVRANADAKPANTMHWTGSVDRELSVEWRGLDVRSRNRSGETAREVHSSVSNGMPASEVRLELSVREGRGDVSIVQQPNSSNGYTAIFKVRDPQSGFGHYEFDAAWR